jgi:hypothetical protein
MVHLPLDLHVHLPHLRQPIGTLIRHGAAPHQIDLTVVHADHDGVDHDIGLHDALADVQTDARRVQRQPKLPVPFRSQILRDHPRAGIEKRQHHPRRGTVEETKVHVAEAVLFVGVALFP